MKVIINLLCNDPYWYDIEDNQHIFQSPYIGLFEFPFSTDETGSEMGIDRETNTFTNKGHVETPLILEFEGGIKNVILSNKTNGQVIKINKHLISNNKLLINTNEGLEEISLVKANGEKSNGLGYVTLDSDFMKLSIGDNEIEYKAESDTGLATLHLRWKNRYLGI